MKLWEFNYAFLPNPSEMLQQNNVTSWLLTPPQTLNLHLWIDAYFISHIFKRMYRVHTYPNYNKEQLKNKKCFKSECSFFGNNVILKFQFVICGDFLKKNWKQNYHMTQQYHFWAYTLGKPDLKETRAPQCSSQHCL